jgi:hypothetical protein
MWPLYVDLGTLLGYDKYVFRFCFKDPLQSMIETLSCEVKPVASHYQIIIHR